MYGNFTATVEEVLQVGTITTSIQPAAFTERLQEILDERLAIIATNTNTSLDALSGTVSISNPGQASATRRRIQAVTPAPLDTSNCDVASMRINVEILMQSSTPEERNTFMTAFDNSDIPAVIANATGSGDNAAVCAAAAITQLSRETVDAPPPPPNIGLTVPDEPLPRGFILVAILVALVIFLSCGIYLWFAFFRSRTKEEDRPKAVIALNQESAETTSFFGIPTGTAVRKGAQKQSPYFVLDGEILNVPGGSE